MGCIKSKEKEESIGPVAIGSTDAPPKTVDPRLPFATYRQLFQMKNSWKAVSRALDDTAKDSLIRFFKAHPHHQALHKNLANLDTEDKMLNSTAFEDTAIAIFTVFDEAMECIEKELIDAAIASLQRAGKLHAKIEGFDESYFKDMEEPFLKAIENTMGDRYTEPTDQNFRRLYEFVTAQMKSGLAPPGESLPNRI